MVSIKQTITTLALLTILMGCTSSANRGETVTGTRVKKSDVDLSQATVIEPAEGESLGAALLKHWGVPNYGPEVTCQEVIDDLTQRGFKIVLLEAHQLKAMSQNGKINIERRFTDSHCIKSQNSDS